MKTCPTEYEEQVALVLYLSLKGLPHFAVPNSTYTTSWSQKRKNTASGVNKGVPDLFVIVNGCLIAIEMKRLKGGVVGPEQKVWLERLNEVGVPAKVCRGLQEAIDFIESM